MEKTDPSEIGKAPLKTNGGSELKLPSAESLLGSGANGTNMSQPVDLKVLENIFLKSFKVRLFIFC